VSASGPFGSNVVLLPAVVLLATVLGDHATGALLPRVRTPHAEHATGGARVRNRRRARRAPAPPRDDELASWCDGVARAVRAGVSLPLAIASTRGDPPIEAALAPVRLALERGTPTADAILRLGSDRPRTRRTRSRTAGSELVIGVVRAVATVGGPSAESLDRVAAVLRERCADAADRQTHAAQARLSAVVLTLLPPAFLGLLAFTGTGVRAALTTAPGVACVTAGVLLNVIGWRWMSRLVGSAR
jgi:Flp pilus assembly protein TadB